MTNPRLKLKLQLLCGDDFAIGPGKAMLLEAIAATGSISAAGRTTGMSYRRSWLLVDSMNRCWKEPLVATAHGGVKGGGAMVTPFGKSVLDRYRMLEAAVVCAAEGPAAALLADVVTVPR